MKIHEYQARDLLASAGIPVPDAVVISSPDAAADAYRDAIANAGTDLAVVKAQVHAGGRGKAGFVTLVRSADEATDAAAFMLSHRMVSVQTGPGGMAVTKILIAAGVDIKHEYYLAITTDRASRRNVLIASAEGGVEIEQVARTNPDAILKQPIDPRMGLQPHQARRLAFELGFTGKQVGQAVKIMLALARLFTDKDCSLAEINPLILTPPSPAHEPSAQAEGPSPVADGGGAERSKAEGVPTNEPPAGSGGSAFPHGRLLAIDAKFNFDDNATFRHKDIAALADPAEHNPAELRAKEHGLSYIPLDGTIGCLVNGAGLAMATMDIIKLHGGEPANFLDVGGSASEEAVTEAFRIILSDHAVKGIMVNIFGGIMDCAVIAQGIVNAAKQVGFTVPLVVRLEGTNVDKGREILKAARSEIPTMTPATDLADAARQVCAAVA